MREALQQAELSKLDHKRFWVYQGRELDFVADAFGIRCWSPDDPDTPGLTPDQVALFTAAFRQRRVACKAGHGTGKSFVLALILITWLYVWAGRVVSTATTWKQVEEVLWLEVRMMLQKSRVYLPRVAGHPLQTELKVVEGCYAIGLSTNDPTAFQGRHHPRLLVLIDEAPGVPDAIHQAIRSLATGGMNHLLMVGNPTTTSGAFYDAFHRPGPWFKLHMSCLNHPNVLLGREVIPGACTRQWVEDERLTYGEDSPIYQSRVLGEFPTMSSDTVIPVAWIERQTDNAGRARAIADAEALNAPITLALDVARYGDNKCILAFRRGQAILRFESWANVSLMVTCGNVVRFYTELREAGQAPQHIIVDEVGVGGGVVDRLLELGLPVISYHSGRPPARRTLFANLRAESWWDLRELLEPDPQTGHGKVWLPPEKQMVSDLSAPKYTITSNGKVVVESKEDMRRRGVASPDYGDTVVMAFALDGIMPVIPPAPPRMDQDHQQFDEDFQKDFGFESLMGVGW